MDDLEEHKTEFKAKKREMYELKDKVLVMEKAVDGIEKNVTKYRDEHIKLLQIIVDQNKVMTRIDTKVEFMSSQIEKIDKFLSSERYQ
jgi:phage shock protein A